MKRWAAAAIMILCALPRAWAISASDYSDVVLHAMADEMARSKSALDMGGLGKPYFVSYTVENSTNLYIWSSFGALKDPHSSRVRYLKASLRVGGPEFDDTHYVAKDYWNYRPPTDRIPVDNQYDALRFAIWSLSDDAYKSALQRLSQKKAYRRTRMIREKIPDISRESVQSFSEPAVETSFDRALWENRLRKLSAIFKSYPAIQRSAVNLAWSSRRVYFVDSEGRRTVKNCDDYQIVAEAATQAEDGLDIGDRRRFIRSRLDEMPPLPALEAEVNRLAQDVTRLAKAPVMDSYIGPVLIEGQGAGEFFNQLLARNLSSPRALWVEDDGLRDRFHAGELASRLGLRVISPLISVSDDPTLESFEGTPLIGHYQVDDEGIVARKVSLIQKGILKEVLMGRSPIKDREHSNGHGRASFWEFPTGRPGNLIISADKTMTQSELKRELLKQAREFGLDYGIIIRRIGEEDLQDEGELLSAPVLVYKVYVKDGHEELVRNAQFAGVTLRALRDIAAVSNSRSVYNYYQLGPYRSARGELQVSIVHPAVLVSEMELKKTEKKPEKLPYLNHPYFGR